MSQTIVLGPYHPSLLEPWKVELTAEKDEITSAKVVTGYVHRGIEKLLENNSYRRGLFIAERVCGICSCVHTGCYSETVEKMFGIDAPERAGYIRVVLLELERLHSHYLTLAMMAHACRRDQLFGELMSKRETVMSLMETLAGNRVNLGGICIGGVRRDLPGKSAKLVLGALPVLQKTSEGIVKSLEKKGGWGSDLAGLGAISGRDALRFGAVGPVLRASGVASDIRKTDQYAAYKNMDFKIIIGKDGDVLARTKMRALETLESIKVIGQALKEMPDGEIITGLPAPFEAESVGRLEAPRGELVYYMSANKSNKPVRVKIRTPTLANHAALEKMLVGQQLKDASKIIESIDPCLACTDR